MRRKVLPALFLAAFGFSTICAQTGTPRILDGGVINGRAISLPKPDYPPTAMAVNATGTVSVQVTVDEGGNVISATLVSGHPLLRDACVSAAKEAKFIPQLLSGQPVKVSGVILYNFARDEDLDTSGTVSKSTDRYIVSKDVLNGKAILLPRPEYPESARAVGAKGTVNVRVIVDENGDVISAEAISGHPLLRTAAVDAAKLAKFKPAMIDGPPVKASGIIIYNFAGEEKNSENYTRSWYPKLITVGVINGRARSLPKPLYPETARAVNAGGMVQVRITVDMNGDITSAEAISGHPLLRAAAVDAARQAKFGPTLADGAPIIVSGILVYNFEKGKTAEKKPM